jgi:hypothetical protein
MTFKEAWNSGNKKIKALFVFALQGLALDIIAALYIIYKVAK